MPLLVDSIRLEISSHCQLKCPLCPTASGEIRNTLGSGFVDVDHFKSLLQKNPNISQVEVSNWGEFLLHPQLPEILRFCHETGVALHASNGANLNFLPEALADDLVRYKVRSIRCSIDGATPDSYARYRVGGDLNNVLINIRRIHKFKKKYNSSYPRLIWQFIAFAHNESELTEARSLAAELGMEFEVKLSWNDDYAPLRDLDKFRKDSGLKGSSRSDFFRKTGKVYLAEENCRQMWLQPQINWDGEMLGCCNNRWKSYGNVFKSGLSEVLNSSAMNRAREAVQGKAALEPGDVCVSCPKFSAMKKSASWIEPKGWSLRGMLHRLFYCRAYVRLQNRFKKANK